MEATVTRKAHRMLFFNTFAFTICFAAWMLNGVLVTFLVDNQVFKWGPIEIGWLMGIPVLAGALFRLPAGMLTDKYGGRPVYSALLIFTALPMFLLSYANSFWSFALASFGFGLCGISFAIGIAYTSVWYPSHWQGRALGIFGAGNAGAALTTLFAPTLLKYLTDNGTNIEGWRNLPIIYAALLFVMGIIFLLFTENKKPASSNKTTKQMLSTLKDVRVWRFGLYYFLVFGCFVAFSQWLVPYFVNVYYLPLVTAGIFAALFSFPSGVIRAVGGWMSDHWGARKVVFGVLLLSVIISLMLTVPRMEISSPGKGIMNKKAGEVTFVSDSKLKVDNIEYDVISKTYRTTITDDQLLILPTKEVWQEPIVKVGDKVAKKELLAKGVTRIYFQANVWIFAILIILIGSIWGIGKAGVYKLIPDHFPEEVGLVGGMVGVLGGLGGFFGPIIFGYLLEWSGLWSSCWMFILLLSAACLIWLNRSNGSMQKFEKEKT
ncbi:MAG: MFS transporter [Ignavibacteriales bacterium CG12_big_fil_rev_8_21_14_0_65_30_8]|nr:MAG: MFS transporter [Ignavibacteriales bacterium CG12_big_fil_rev_8_21_14_0_65_30_8]